MLGAAVSGDCCASCATRSRARPIMDEEQLIKAASSRWRTASKPEDPRLEQLVRGTLSAEDRARLQADAARDPALQEVLELLSAPFDAASLEKMKRAARAARRQRSEERRVGKEWRSWGSPEH